MTVGIARIGKGFNVYTARTEAGGNDQESAVVENCRGEEQSITKMGSAPTTERHACHLLSSLAGAKQKETQFWSAEGPRK